MGQTSKPLRIILTDPAMADWPEFRALSDQGHDIVVIDLRTLNLGDVDLILGPTAHVMDARHRRYLTLAIGEGRRRRYR